MKNKNPDSKKIKSKNRRIRRVALGRAINEKSVLAPKNSTLFRTESGSLMTAFDVLNQKFFRVEQAAACIWLALDGSRTQVDAISLIKKELKISDPAFDRQAILFSEDLIRLGLFEIRSKKGKGDAEVQKMLTAAIKDCKQEGSISLIFKPAKLETLRTSNMELRHVWSVGTSYMCGACIC